MPNVIVSSYDFPASLSVPDPDTPVDFSRNELLTAIVTVGKSQADDLRHPSRVLDCWREIRWRASLLAMAITEQDEDFRQSAAYSALDPSEKVGVSYMLGLAAAGALCTRFLHMPFLMHLDVYGALDRYNVRSSWLERLDTLQPCATAAVRLEASIAAAKSSLGLASDDESDEAVKDRVLQQVFQHSYPSAPDAGTRSGYWEFLHRLTRGARPDLFGLEVNGGVAARYVIAEAKGRSGQLNADDKLDCQTTAPSTSAKLNRRHGGAMLQSLSRDIVVSTGDSPVSIGRHLAVFSHFEKDRRWAFSWKDPENGEMTGKDRISVPPGPLIADYYANLLALGMVEQALKSEGEDDFRLEGCPDAFAVRGAEFAVQFHPRLHGLLCKAFAAPPEKRDRTLDTVPGLLGELERAADIGPGTGYGINGVGIKGTEFAGREATF